MPPIYEYACLGGHDFERYLPVAQYQDAQYCECGELGVRRISLPMIFVKPDICYDSPITGEPITSMAKRLDDLAKHNCEPYDPDIKQHIAEKNKREEIALEKAVDETIDREIATMPARKREKLEAELHGGMTVEPIRQTAPYKPITTEIHHD